MKKFFLPWIKIIYPLSFVALILMGTVWVFYGNFTMELTGNSQKSTFQKLDLLEFELSLAGERSNATQSVVAFSLNDSDLRHFDLKKSGAVQNISLADHLKFAKKILKSDPKHVYLHWFFPSDPTSAEVKEILKAPVQKSKISIISSFDRAEVLKKVFPDTFEVLVADFCNGKSRTVCPYNPNWSYLAIQKLADTFGNVSNRSLSNLLPNANPSYIFTPLKRGSVPVFSYGDLDTIPSEKLQNKIVFLGTDLLQGSSGMTAPEDIGRVPSLYENKSKPLRANGTPIHEFLALSVENILSHGWISVIGNDIAMAITFGVPLLLLLFLFNFSIAFATTFFLISACFIIFGNIISIRNFYLYFPDYDCLFLSVLCLTGGGFVKYALEYSRYKAARDKEKFLLSKVDIKYNFISLISHNLNTPVAKIKVLCERILKNHPTNPKPFLDISYYLADMQMAIRAILSSTRLEEGHIAFEAIQIDRLEDDLGFDVKALFKRRYLDFHYELEILSRLIDDRKLIVTLVSSVGFLAPKNSSLFFSLTSEGEVVTLEWISTTQVPDWNAIASADIKQSDDPIFNFIFNFTLKRKINFILIQDQDGDTLRLSFNQVNPIP